MYVHIGVAVRSLSRTASSVTDRKSVQAVHGLSFRGRLGIEKASRWLWEVNIFWLSSTGLKPQKIGIKKNNSRGIVKGFFSRREQTVLNLLRRP